jgi:hypothetical protein
MNTFRLFLLCSAAFLVACVSEVAFDTQYNRSVNFSELKTFAWNDNDVAYVGSRNEDIRKRVDNMIRNTVITKLTQKGYTQAPLADADFLVSYHIVVTQELDTMAVTQQSAVTVFNNSNINLDETYTIIYPDRTVGGGPNAAPGELTVSKGTLLLFVVDGETKRLMWQGTAVGTAVTSREALSRSRKAIDGLLAQFPPG